MDGLLISRSPIEVYRSDGVFIPALLRMDLSLDDLEEADRRWQPFQHQIEESAARAGISIQDHIEHWHWRWNRKWQPPPNQILYGGIEVQNELQGIVILKLDKQCRFDTQRGLPIVYVDYIATAPWNDARLLKLLGHQERYKGIGGILLTRVLG